MNMADGIITSKQNRIVVDAAKLLDKKAREKAELFRFDGLKLFEEALQKGIGISRVLICESKADAIMRKLDEYADKLEKTAVSVLCDEAFAKVSDEQAPEGVVCIAPYPASYARRADREVFAAVAADSSRRFIALEAVRDPGNLGTVMRSAAAFGVNTLVLSRDCADVFNPKTVRGAMGALFKMNIFVFEDITEAIEILRENGRNVYAAALDKNAVKLGETLFLPTDTAVIGNEGHGLSERTVGACTQSLYIPMEEGSESLNAAVAASVILWSMYRGK